MNKMLCSICLALAILLLGGMIAQLQCHANVRDQGIEQSLYERYVELSSKLAPLLWSEQPWSQDSLPPLNDFRRFTPEGNRVATFGPNARASVRLPFFLVLGVDHDDFFVVIHREKLAAARRRRELDKKPSITAKEAVARAHRYLELIGHAVPADHAMEVFFGTDDNRERLPVWNVAWFPCYDGVYFDHVATRWDHSRYMVITFHEELGLIRYERKVGIYPAPRAMERNVSASEAIEVALSVVDRVRRNPSYLTLRGPQSESSIIAIERPVLVLREPTGMLDLLGPEYMALTSRLPKETRLSWRVTFLISNPILLSSKDSDTPTHFSQHYLFIYIDAENGKSIGFDAY